MRTETYFAGAALVRDLERAGTAAHVHHDGGDLIHIQLKGGEHVWIHLIESSIPATEIIQTLKNNAANDLHALFLFWADRMLPPHNYVCEPDAWMRPLLPLYGDKLYGYEVRGRDIFIFPVYFEGTGKVRRVRYGSPVDLTKLTCRRKTLLTADLNGVYLWADFGARVADASASEPAATAPHPLERFYAALGVAVTADARAVKRAYRRLAREFHPDLNADPTATARMQQINDAYERILEAFEQGKDGSAKGA